MNFPGKQMKPVVFAIIAAFALGALLSAPAEGARKDWPKRITIGGGPLQGTIQFQALGWSSVLNKVLKLNSSVESTAGATVNARLISQGRQDFGFGTSSSISDAAYHGRGFAKGKRYKNLRIMSPVDSSGVQFWTPAKSPIMKAEDIQGRRLNISRPGSGVDRFGRNLMKVVGLKPSQVTNVGHGQANRMMQDGILDVAATIGAPPHPAVASITSQLPFRVFGLGHGKWAEMMLAKYPFYVKTAIVGGMYKGNPKPVKTIGQTNWLGSGAHVPNDLVYEVVKATFANKKDLVLAHRSWEALDINKMTKANIPVHPGAIRYYKEKGIKLPKSAMMAK